MIISTRLIILFASSILSAQVSAQIHYQDIIPDKTMNSWDSKDIHIDSSSTSSLSYGAQGNLTIWEEFGTQIVINAFSNCEVLMNGTYPAALNLSQSIASTATWAQPSYAILNNGTQGNWIGVTDKYLGVRIKNGSQWLYGWIRMDVNTAGTSVTIKDYACNRTSNASINAGQTLTKINDLLGKSENLISTYPNPFSSYTTIKTGKSFQNVTLILYNAFGQKTKELANISGQEIEIYKDNLPSGIYSMRLIEDNEIIATQKLIIID